MEGYIEIDGKPVWVKVIKTWYCHSAPVVRWVTDGKTIWETREPIFPDLTYFCGECWFVPQ